MLLCVTSIPILVLTLVWWFFGVPISAFRPVLSDEITYWHETLTFSRVGFHGGYYTLGEVLNPSGYTPFGFHGPGFTVAYGLFGAVFGWYRHSVVVLNLAVIALACWVWAALSHLTSGRLLLSILLLVTFWHMLFWAPTGMQESLHHAAAIAMAACVVYMLRPIEEQSYRRATTVLGWTILAIVSFIRPSWIVVMPVWATVTTSRSTRVIQFAAIAGSLVAAALIVLAYSRTIAPFGTGFFFLRALNLSVTGQSLIDSVSFNIRRMMTLGEYQPIEVLHRFQYWGVLLAAAALAVRAWRSLHTRSADAGYILVVVVVMSTALALMLLLYTPTNWAEQRVLSAFLLFGALVCVAAPGRAALGLVLVLIASNLAAIGLFLHSFKEGHHDRFVWDRRGIYSLQDALDGHVVYRKGAPRWCNTLLTQQFPPYLIAVPAGIGISIVREPDQMETPRSRYLLIDPAAIADFKRPPRLEPVAVLPYGTLYRNLESPCP